MPAKKSASPKKKTLTASDKNKLSAYSPKKPAGYGTLLPGGVSFKPAKLTKVAQTKKGKKADSKNDAKHAGKRISKSGNVYYETRSNRAD